MRIPLFWIFLAAAPCCVNAQWMHYPAPGTPRSKDGKPDLNAPAIRNADGRPDLSGIWVPEPTPLSKILPVVQGPTFVPPPSGSEPIIKYFANILADFKTGEAPLQPTASVRTDDPALSCLPTGMPMFDTSPVPRKIVQTPGLILLLSENDNTFRQIFTDGRGLPQDPEPSWLGSSVGEWDGETLVVVTAGMNGRSSLDLAGHEHSDRLRVSERFHRLSFGKIELQVTLDDPQTFTKPLTLKFNWVLLPDTDLIESFCSENEKDHNHVSKQ